MPFAPCRTLTPTCTAHTSQVSFALLHAEQAFDLLRVKPTPLHVEVAQAQGRRVRDRAGTPAEPDDADPPVKLKRAGGKGVHLAGLQELLVSNAQQRVGPS